jgi:phage-related protein
VAVLTTVPALVASIGLEVGVLYLAFKGVGTAIQGAFAAKNATELKAALAGLTPAAQSFVKSLLPLKPLFEYLKNVSQQNFFKALGDAATKVINNIAPLLRQNVGLIATALGGAVRSIALAFASPDFHNFIAAVIPATIEWVRAFGPAFAQFLIGLIDLGRAAIPLLTDLGKMVNSGLASLGKNLSELSRDPKFREWLGSMEATLKALGPLFKSLFQFVVVFLDQLNKAGGKALIEQLAKAVDLITAFLATEAGMRALNELIGLAIGSFYILAGGIIVILFLAASVQAFIDWLVNTALPAIGKFFADIGKAIGDWFVDASDKIEKFFSGFGVTVSGVANAIGQKFVEIRDAVSTRIGEAIQFVKEIPGKVVDAIGNLGTLLFNAGRNLINGLINGIENAIPGLRSALGFITNMLPNWKGPEEKDKAILKPSGEAVMAGFGEGLAAGASDIRKMLGDFTTGIGDIGISNTSNHILFGANALQINFRGALPTQDEAMATGVAVGAGINSQLAARNTRLAVRTL